MARPTDYREEFCDEVIRLGKQGKSRAEIASALDCSRQTLANWEAAHPEFLDALQRAKDEELAWWEAEARKGLNKGSSFNAAIWSKSVNGRFPNEPYRDRVQVTGKDDGPIRQSHAFDLTTASDEELDVIERVIRRTANAGGDQGGESPAEG